MKKISLILAGILFSCSLQAVNDESNIGKGVESDQIQMRKRSNGVIKKSIEKTGEEILITEYDQQGNIIKITRSNCPDCGSFEFNLKDGKIISAKDEFDFGTTPVIDKQKNIVTIVHNSEFSTFEFNEFGIKKYSVSDFELGFSHSYEYNKDGLLVKKVTKYEDAYEGTSSKTTATYTYDVMNQNWKKRTETDNQGNKTVTTRTVEYW